MARTVALFMLLGLLAACSRETPPRLVVDGASFTLRGTWHADLDRAQESRFSPDVDVWWEQVTATERYWTPRNGARFAPMGTARPDFAACRRAALSGARIDGSDGPSNRIPSASFLCGRTAEGRTVVVEVLNYGYILDLRVWVWDR